MGVHGVHEAVHGGCMAGSRNACLIAAFAAGFAVIGGETPVLADDPASPRQEQVCGGDEIARGTVGRVLDGRTFVLDNGREVRLAAIEVAPLAVSQDRADPAGRAAAAALGALAAGDQVVLRRTESGSDRYGRLLAYAYTLRDGDEFLLQRELVAEGFARRIGDITVTILKRNERSFAAAGLDLRSLASRRIRIRGWIEARGGERAWIEAERPEQIEMAD
jgi:endonuclease YncB( thermonuclease family)